MSVCRYTGDISRKLDESESKILETIAIPVSTLHHIRKLADVHVLSGSEKSVRKRMTSRTIETMQTLSRFSKL